jgi:TadE-like protein
MFTVFRHRRHSRGQALVEFALLVPVLLLLLLGAIDFGRLFLGWVSLQNMARVGANFAAVHPEAWPAGSATSASAATDRARYESLMLASVGATDCPVATPLPAPSFGLTKNPGDPVRVDLSCQFAVITPLIDAVVGKHVTLSASSNFPITSGCLTDCGSSPAVTPPALSSNCRTVPQVDGLSVAGARLAWTAAGLITGGFSPSLSDGLETATVHGPIGITLPADAEACPSGKAFFSSAGTVTPGLPAPGPGCVPNLTGVTVAAARTSWTAAGFTGSFTPPQNATTDPMIVVLQTTSPTSQPGDCPPAIPATATVTVSYTDPPPPPPPAPCKVPSFIGTSSTLAQATWTAANFTGSLTFAQPNKLPYTIQSQTLVGGTYLACGSSIGVTR